MILTANFETCIETVSPPVWWRTVRVRVYINQKFVVRFNTLDYIFVIS